MITIDYHGVPVVDAVNDVMGIIDLHRMRKQSVEYEFIVGFGRIRDALPPLLRGYGLKPTFKLGNTGVILCLIE